MNGKILIHLRSPVLTQSGYGVVGRQIFDYLSQDDRFLVCLEAINWGQCGYIHNHPNQKKYYEAINAFQNFKDKGKFGISIHHTIPNEFHRTAQFNIGVTAGIEVDRITKVWVDKCNEMDCIIVPSQFSKKIMEGTRYDWENQKTGEKGTFKIEKPVMVIPHWFERHEVKSEQVLNLETEFNFLFVGQWGLKGGYHEDRKNVAALIRDFYNVFKEEPKAGLVLKTQLINNCAQDRMELIKRVEEIKSNFKTARCKLYLIHETLSDEQMTALYTHPKIKAMVTLAHGEGFGIPVLEAAAYGLPVIATNWSGYLDFLKEKKGFIPIDYELKEIPKCQIWNGVIDEKSMWAEFNFEDFKKKIRKFFNSSKPIQEAAKKHVPWLDENFSKEVVLKQWQSFFDQVVGEKEHKPGQPTIVSTPKTQKEQAIDSLRALVEPSEKEKVLYIMAQSYGDVAISTALVDSLMVRHPDADFYFATRPQYKEVLDRLVEEKALKVIDYNDALMASELTREVWDVVYNPGVNVQFQFSNWLNGDGTWGVRLMEEFAKACNIFPNSIKNYVLPEKECRKPDGQYVAITAVSSKDAKSYMFWEDVVHNIKIMLPDVTVIQLGFNDEKLINGAEDYRGTSFAESVFLVRNAIFHVSPDTSMAHVAAAVETPHVTLYASTHAYNCAPIMLKNLVPQYSIESTNACNPKCYKDVCCQKKNGLNCLSTIKPQEVMQTISSLVEAINKKEESKMAARINHD